MTYEIIEKQPVTLTEIKSVLEKNESEDFRAQKTYEYVKEFAKLNKKQAQELKQKLMDLNIIRLKEEIIVKIIDLLPKSEGELKAILQSFNVTLPKDQLKSILNTVVEFL